MTTLQKILISALLVCLTGTLVFIAYQQVKLNEKQESIEKSVILQKELADGITRSQSQYVNKDDLDKFARQLNINLDVIKKDMDKLNANVTAINSVVVTSTGYTYTGLPSTYVEPRPNFTLTTTSSCYACKDSFSYLSNRQIFSVNEIFHNSSTVPFGKVGFSAWLPNPWDITVYNREYDVNTVIGLDDNRRMIAYNTFTVVVDGKKYPIRIASAQTRQIYPDPKFRFDPRLHFDFNAGVQVSPTRFNATPAISVNLFSYGKYREQSDLLIGKLGVGFGLQSEKVEFIITPVAYNIGQHIPFTSGNIFAAASLQINTDAQVTLAGQLGVKF